MRFTKEFSRLVDKDLKNRDPLTDAEVSVLHADLDGWIAVLEDFRGEIEIQFTYFEYIEAKKRLDIRKVDVDFTPWDFDNWYVDHLKAVMNATRLRKSIESKLVYVRYERQRQANQHLSDDSDAERGSHLSAAH